MSAPFPTKPEPGESMEDFRLRQKRAGIDLAIQARKRLKLMREAIRKEQLDDLALLRGDLTDLEPLILRWPIERLLKLMRGVGPARAALILNYADVNPRRKVSQLSYETRARLAQLVAEARDPYGAVAEQRRQSRA